MPRSLRSFFLTLALLMSGWVLSSSPVLAAAQINNQINYQARLMDASGFPVADGNYSIIFSLYDASTAGNRIWTAAGTLGTPTALTVNVQNGLFTILLGDTGQNTLDTVNWNSDQLYLGVTINADAEMIPRKRLASAPQAFNSRQLQGMYASSTASGGQTLFTINQTENTAATGTRSALDVRSNGTSNANDFLVRGINDLGATVFQVNRQGNVSTTRIGLQDGSLSLPAVNFSSSPDSGLFYDSAASALQFSINSSVEFYLDTNNLYLMGGLQPFVPGGSIGSLGNAWVDGFYSGTVSTTNLIVSGTVGSNLVPSTDLAFSLGDATRRWNSFFGNVSTTNLHVSSTLSYGAAYGSSLTLQTPTNPVSVGLGATTGTADDVFVSNGYAYVADFANGLMIYDVADPTNPVLISSSAVGGGNEAWQVKVAGQYAYVAYSDAGFHVFDISDPYAPVSVASINSGVCRGLGLYVAGPYAYTGCNTVGQFRIIDIHQPTNPHVVGTVNGFAATFGVYVQGSYAYVADAGSGSGGSLDIIDISNPSAPVRVGVANVTSTNVVVEGRYAYVAGGSSSAFYVIDVASSTNPMVVATTTLPAFAWDLDVSGGYAYVGNFGSGMQVIDVRDPLNPVIVANFDAGAQLARGVHVVGKYAYLAESGNGLRVIDLQGADFSTARIGDLQVGTFSSIGDAEIGNNLFVRGSINAGIGGIHSQGIVAAGTVSTTAIYVSGQTVCLSDGTNCASGGGSDSNWTFNAAGDFVRNATPTTDVVIGSSTVAGAPFVFLNNTTTSRLVVGRNTSTGAGADIVLGATTASGMNSQFQLTGDDLFVAGNIGSASSIYTNGELVVGASSTHYADGSIIKLDGSQELTTFLNYGFLMRMTGSLLVQATPDVANATPGAIYLYAGNGTSTLESGSEITLQGGTGYNDGSGGAVSITGGGSGTSTFSGGGGVFISGGAASANGQGGNVSIAGADTFGTGSAGAVGITTGNSFGTGDAGGLSITTGIAFGSGAGGNITMTPGVSIGTGLTGSFTLASTFGFDPPEFRLTEEGSFGTDYVGFRAPTSVTATNVWVLPAADGSSGQVLSTDGVGNLSFITAGGGGGDSNWTYVAASNTYLTVTSTANVLIGGTSTTNNDLPLFTMDGDDLLVAGSIGTDYLFASNRVDAPYLNRWFESPLLTQTVYKGGRADVPVGSQPHGVAFDGSYIWVANYGSNTVSKIDPLTNTVVATTTVATGVDGMAFDGKYLWVANGNGLSNNVSKINVITNQVVATIDLGATYLFAQSVTFDGTYIWVTHTGTFPAVGGISKIDPNTNTLVAQFGLGVGSYGIAYDGRYLWVANLDSAAVLKVDPINNVTVATTTGTLSPIGVVYDGSAIWVSSAFTDVLYKINPTSSAVIATVSLDSGANPHFMAYDGTFIWVAQNGTTTVAKIDPRINSLVERISIPGASRSIAVDGSHVWITNALFDEFVTKVSYGAGNGAASNLSVSSLIVNSTTGSATGTSNYAAVFAYASGTTSGGICIDDKFNGATCPSTGIGGASLIADGTIIANRFDLAEMYAVTGTHESGDVLVLDSSSTATVKRSDGTTYDSKIIGIASDQPGFLLGWGGGAKVALTGRVPTKISMNNGEVHVGDALTSSDVPGYAMKATQPGMVLGYALEDVSATGTGEVFVSVGFWAGLAFGPGGAVQIDDSGNVSIMNDLHVGGRLFPSLKGGGIQNDWYLFIDDTDPTSTYLSTNADGFQSMDTYDFAERYYSPDDLESGDLVVVSDSGRTHVQRSMNEDDMLLGIVSTRPAFIAGRPATSTFPIALSGRVPTKVSNMNGAIKAGDPLAPTSIPGVAAKAIHSGPIVGLALEDFEGANITKIEVYVNPSYWVNEHEVAETPAPEAPSQIVVSQGKQGFATITAGSKKVRIEFPSLGAYPNVQVTPRGSIGGSWWTDGYTDTGFEIILSETEEHDVVFAWRVEATTAGDVMRMSDGTYAAVDPVTGMPAGWVTTSSTPIVEEVVPEPVPTESTSTEPVVTPEPEPVPEGESVSTTTP